MTYPNSLFHRAVLAAIPVAVLAAGAQAATFFGPSGYLSAADIPAGLYDGGAPTFLDDFEDGTLDGGITASAGAPYGPSSITDSVDGDDGSIDGSGTSGWSFFSGSGATGITFTFASAVTAAGIVWTDGLGLVTFEAFDTAGASLGSISGTFADTTFTGGTAEDRFFGVSDAGGIGSIFISNAGGGIEVDHLQYGNAATGGGINPVPVPASLPLLLGALGLGAAWRRAQRS